MFCVAGAVARALFSVLVALTGATAVTTATCIVVLAHLTLFILFRSSFLIHCSAGSFAGWLSWAGLLDCLACGCSVLDCCGLSPNVDRWLS